jgi:hypothetical protein
VQQLFITSADSYPTINFADFTFADLKNADAANLAFNLIFGHHISILTQSLNPYF